MLHFSFNYANFLGNYENFLGHLNTCSTVNIQDDYLITAIDSWADEDCDDKEKKDRNRVRASIRLFVNNCNTSYSPGLNFEGANLKKLPPIFPLKFPTQCCPLANLFTQKLEVLYLSNNKLTTLPECIENLPALTDLCLMRNQLTYLPDSIGNLTSLKELWVGGNKLTTLPNSLKNLTTLVKLVLYGNKLATLPNCIENLTQLTYLDLSDNQLTILPRWINNLTNLSSINLKKNKLTQLPNGILSLPKLKECNIENDRAGWNWSPHEKNDQNPIANDHLNNGA